jgi:hypothetical protein
MRSVFQRLLLVAVIAQAVACEQSPTPAPKTKAVAFVPVEPQPEIANKEGDGSAGHLKAASTSITPGDRFHGKSQLGALPAGHPPVPSKPSTMTTSVPHPASEQNVPLPLLLKGPGSAEELSRRLATLEDTDTRKRLEEAFRLTFTVQRTQRQPRQAATLLAPLLKETKAAASAERILGYVSVSSGFKVDEALGHYKRAIELEPDYGEAHYALGFIYAMNDRDQGEKHFRRALSLGVTDARNLARFYSTARKQDEAQKGH